MRTELHIEADVARITIDDGKVNAMSAEMLEEICGRLEEAGAGARVTILRGRPGIFSAGFDMPTFSAGLEPCVRMLGAGMKAILSMLEHPHPIVVACAGHAYPMGAFLMMAADERYAARGDFRIGMNEAAIGLTVPRFALALAKHRLSPPAFAHIATGRLFDPEDAIAAGYVDRAVAADDLDAVTEAAASRLLTINLGAYAATKRRINHDLSERIRSLSEPETLTAELVELANP